MRRYRSWLFGLCGMIARGLRQPPSPRETAPVNEARLSPDSSVCPATEIQLFEQSGLFDEQFYREANPDVSNAGLSPLEHFLRIGGFEGRQPNPLFDPSYYLAIYPDVARGRINPALHYFQTGALEGRNPSPDFDSGFY